MWTAQIARGVLSVCLVVLGATVAAAQSNPPDTMDNRRMLAQHYADVTMPVMLEDVKEGTTKNIPAGPQRDRVRKLLNEVLTIETLEEIAIPAMVRHFTVEELSALIEFYQSPVGNSILRKFGAFTADIQPAVMEIVLEAVLSTGNQDQ